MKRNQRVRWEIAYATRLNVAGGARNADLDIIERRYNLSSAGTGGTRAKGIFYSGGDYWN